MTSASKPLTGHRIGFAGTAGNRLIGDEFRLEGARGATVLLAHGGGQTRHSWQGTAEQLARAGFRAITFDQRGHGDSDWVAGGAYTFDDYADDLAAVARALVAVGSPPPVVVGASLGGIAGLLAAGEGAPGLISALVLVDITPRVKADGVARILAFMAADAERGFSSLEAAADAISAYLPHRPRPSDLSGLSKNLRRGADGRYRWHWDPRFLEQRADALEHARHLQARQTEAARRLRIPALLVRGRESELVGEDEAAEFLLLAPHAELADVSGARHMVAGDRNDVFTAAVTSFLARTPVV